MQAGNFSRINKRAGGNKAMQVGIFQNSLVKNHKKWKNLKKIINVQEVIRPCRLEIFTKLMICAARLLDTLEYGISTSYHGSDMLNIKFFTNLFQR